MLHIGITGGIGSGKSTVCRVFQALGVPVYDADTGARHLMEHDPLLRSQLQAAFGPEAYDAAGRLNRPWLAATVFNQPARLAELNALVHPRVGEDFAAWAAARAASGAPYVLKEAALLYEAGSYRQLDQIIVVLAPEALRVARVRHRDPQRSEAEVRAIMAKQWTDAQKLALAQHVLHNDEQQFVLPQVLALHQRFSGVLGA